SPSAIRAPAGGAPFKVSKGQAVIGPADHVHLARNDTTKVVKLYAMYLDLPAGTSPNTRARSRTAAAPEKRVTLGARHRGAWHCGAWHQGAWHRTGEPPGRAHQGACESSAGKSER